MKIVLIKHNPQGHHLISHLVPVPYVRPIFVFQTLSVWRSPVLHFISFAQHEFARRDNVHDLTSVFYPSETLGHTRVLLAFYTPSVTSKSLLISLPFLEREGVYFLLALSYPSFESASPTAPCFKCFLHRRTDQHSVYLF